MDSAQLQTMIFGAPLQADQWISALYFLVVAQEERAGKSQSEACVVANQAILRARQKVARAQSEQDRADIAQEFFHVVKRGYLANQHPALQ